MSTFDVVQRPVDKAGSSFVEVRREDGHGSEIVNPSFVEITNPVTTINQGDAGVTPWPVDISGATIEIGNLQQLSVSRDVAQTNINIESGNFTVNVPYSNDTLLGSLTFKFTSNSPRNIDVFDSTGKKYYSEVGNTNLDLDLDFESDDIDSGTTLTISVSQTPSACLMDVFLLSQTGSSALSGNPVISPDSYGDQSEGNSTFIPLTDLSPTFTGVGEKNAFPDGMVSIATDKSMTCYIDISTDDGINYDTSIPVFIDAGLSEFHVLRKAKRTFRIRLVKTEAGDQTYLRCGVYYGTFGQKITTLATPIREDEDCITVRNVSEELLMAESKYQGRFIINKFGRNPNINTGHDVWDGGGVYTGFPSGAAELFRITSTSPLDAGAVFRVSALDGNYNIINFDITLGTGATPTGVSTLTGIRAYRFRIVTAGAGQVSNVGNITLSHNITTVNVFSVIPPTRGQSNLSGFTIPVGYSGYLVNYNASLLDGGNSRMEVDIWTRNFNQAERLQYPFVVTNSNSINRSRYGGIKFEEKTDFIFRVSSASSVGDLTISWDMRLVRNIG